MSRLIVVSNRVARPAIASKGSEGGLAVGVKAAMQDAGGVWFGWNGKIENRANIEPQVDQLENISYVTTGLTQAEYNTFYKGFSNSVLWPLFHQRPELMRYSLKDYQGYLEVNQKFVNHLKKFLQPTDTIWIHDYHLIPMGAMFRKAGLKNPIGFFLHTPLPPLDLLRTIPSHKDLLEYLLHYDLVGFQTETDLRAFRESVQYSLKGKAYQDGYLQLGDLRCYAAVYPIGIESDSIPSLIERGKVSQDYQRLASSLGNRKLMIGVDRLDYSKGLVERFNAYEKLLNNRPDLHREIVFLQVAPTSRADLQAYGDLAQQIDSAAGHIIGSYADFDWMPLRYINRGFRRNAIFAMYQLARIGVVTPLRDGMNLVAKEYVAAQDPENPGVLVLSKMAGAAAELDAAVIVNPYDRDSVAQKLAYAIDMPLGERKERWQSMMAILKKNNIHQWNKHFKHDLMAAHANKHRIPTTPPTECLF